MANLLTRDAILEADDIQEEIVEVPQWGGGAVKIRGMSVEARTGLLREITDPKTDKIDQEKASLYAFVVGVVEPKFSADDLPALRKKSAAAIDLVTKQFLKLSGIDTDSLAEARKNS